MTFHAETDHGDRIEDHPVIHQQVAPCQLHALISESGKDAIVDHFVGLAIRELRLVRGVVVAREPEISDINDLHIISYMETKR